MSQHFKQMQHGSGDAKRLLRERLAREEMGDAAYEKMLSQNGDRAFKIAGIVFIVVLAAVVFAVTALDY